MVPWESSDEPSLATSDHPLQLASALQSVQATCVSLARLSSFENFSVIIHLHIYQGISRAPKWSLGVGFSELPYLGWIDDALSIIEYTSTGERDAKLAI